jgi:putative sigma-54 modulation protein
MEVLVRNAEGNLSSQDREYASKKLSRLDRYFNQAHKVEMVHREEKNQHRVEITVFADGFTVRGEEHDESLRAAIDLVAEKLERRLRKLKGRIIDTHRRKGQGIPDALTQEEPEPEEEETHISIAERKIFQLKPMSPDEAALQMEMLGHPFFIFLNELSGRVEVLYKRRDGRYGVLQPET